MVRHNQKLEQDTIAILEEKLQLQRQAESLVHRLDVVLHNKFESTKMAFDADTPIDKTLSYLQGIIKVFPLRIPEAVLAVCGLLCSASLFQTL